MKLINFFKKNKKEENKEMLLQNKNRGERLYKNPEWLYQESVIKGRSFGGIGRQFHVVAGAVSYFHKKFLKEGIYTKYNKNSKWSEEENSKLIELKNQGYKNYEIADKMFRTLDSIESRIRDLKIGNQKFVNKEKAIESNKQNETDKPEFFKYTYDLLEELKNNPKNNPKAIENIKQEVSTIDEGLTKGINQVHEKYTEEIGRIYGECQERLKDIQEKIIEAIEQSKIKIKSVTKVARHITNIDEERENWLKEFNKFAEEYRSKHPNCILKIINLPDYTYKETDWEKVKEINMNNQGAR